MYGAHGANMYWKLGRPSDNTTAQIKQFFKDKGFHFKESASKTRLLTLYSRFERELLSYEACTTAELKAFCLQRKILLTGNLKKGVLVLRLEEEDEDATFSQFLDLPPELRNRVYSIHFESFANLALPTTPPITRVSQQLRQETLLLFYQSCTAIVNISGATSDTLPRVYPRFHFGRPNTLRYKGDAAATGALFSGLAEPYLGNLRTLCLRGTVTTATAWVEASWDFDLASGVISARVTRFEADPEDDLMDGLPAAREEHGVRIKTELETIVAREGKIKLRRDDLELFRRVLKPEE